MSQPASANAGTCDQVFNGMLCRPEEDASCICDPARLEPLQRRPSRLREIGVAALGITAPDDAGQMLTSGTIPVAVVLEATGDFASVQPFNLLLLASPQFGLLRERKRFHFLYRGQTSRQARIVAFSLYRPLRIGDIAAHVHDALQKGQAA